MVEIVRFTEGQELSTRSICSHSTIFRGKVVRRTAKTVWLEIRDEVVKRKVHVWQGAEYVYPFGKYSMCPIFRAR